MVIFQALVGCYDVLILGKSPIKWRQCPDMTLVVDWDVKASIQTNNYVWSGFTLCFRFFVVHILYACFLGLNVYSMLKHETLVLTLAALEKIEQKLLEVLHSTERAEQFSRTTYKNYYGP